MTELEILKGMRALLADPARWTQFQFARTSGGARTSVTAADAHSFCMLGAADKVEGIERGYYRDNARTMPTLERVIKKIVGTSIGISSFNDVSTHARVLPAIDEAIAILEAKQPSTCAAVKKLIDDAVRIAEVADA